MSPILFNIRDAYDSDIPAIAALENECFSTPWTKQGISAEMKKPGACFLVAVADTKLIGYLSFTRVLDEGYINNIAVSANFRGRGIGHALVAYALRVGQMLELSFLTLEVRPSNAFAVRLYSDCGFLHAGTRKNFYSVPTEDALLMTYTY